MRQHLRSLWAHSPRMGSLHLPEPFSTTPRLFLKIRIVAVPKSIPISVPNIVKPPREAETSVAPRRRRDQRPIFIRVSAPSRYEPPWGFGRARASPPDTSPSEEEKHDEPMMKIVAPETFFYQSRRDLSHPLGRAEAHSEKQHTGEGEILFSLSGTPFSAKTR